MALVRLWTATETQGVNEYIFVYIDNIFVYSRCLNDSEGHVWSLQMALFVEEEIGGLQNVVHVQGISCDI